MTWTAVTKQGRWYKRDDLSNDYDYILEGHDYL